MRTVDLMGLAVGEAPVLVATALADTVDGMLEGANHARAAGADVVELRIDRLSSDDEAAELVCRIDMPHVVSCRTPDFGGFFAEPEDARIARLGAACEAGAAAVDIEYLAEPAHRDRLIATARDQQIPLLIGYENMQKTPAKEELIRGIRGVAELGPSLVKLAVRAASHADLLIVLEMAREMREMLDVPFAAIALGPYGASSRPLCCVLGGSFTYCAIEAGGAAGQLTVTETRNVMETVSEQRWLCSSS